MLQGKAKNPEVKMKKNLLYCQGALPNNRAKARSADRSPRYVTQRLQDHYKRGTQSLRDYIQKRGREPLIGLEFILEYKVQSKPDKNNTHHYCEICQLNLPLIPMIEHLLGVKHRTRYLEKVFPFVLKALPDNRDDVILFLRKMAMQIEMAEGTKMFKSDPTMRAAVLVPGEKIELPKPRRNSKWETEASREKRMEKALEYLNAFQIDNETEASAVANLIEKLSNCLRSFDNDRREKAVFNAKVNRAKDVAALIMHEATVQRNFPPNPVPMRRPSMDNKAKENGDESGTEKKRQPPKDPAVINAEYVRFFKELLQEQKAAKEKGEMLNPDKESEDLGYDEPPRSPWYGEPPRGPGYDDPPGGPWYDEPPGGPWYDEPPRGPRYGGTSGEPEFDEPPVEQWREGPPFGTRRQGFPPGAMRQEPPENFEFQNNMSGPQRPQSPPTSRRQYDRETPRAKSAPYAPKEGASKSGSQPLSEPSEEEVQFVKQLMNLLSSAPENSQASSTEMMVKSLLHKKPPTGNIPTDQPSKAASSLTSAEKALYEQLMMMVANPTSTSSNEMMQKHSETKKVKPMAKATGNQNPSGPMAAVPRGHQKSGNAQMDREGLVPGNQRIGKQDYGAAERNSMNPNSYSDPQMDPLRGHSRSQMQDEASYPPGMYGEESDRSSYGRVPAKVADRQYDDYTADRAPNPKTGLPHNAPRSGNERVQDRGMMTRSQEGNFPGHGLRRPLDDPGLAQRERGLRRPLDDPGLAQRERGLRRPFDDLEFVEREMAPPGPFRGPDLAQRESGLRRPVENPEWAQREKGGVPNEKRARLDRGLVVRCDPEGDEEPPGDPVASLSVDLLKRIRGKDMYTVTAMLNEFAEHESSE